jgi:hypothetical protein
MYVFNLFYACSITYAILHAIIIFVSLSTRYHLCSFVCLPYLHYINCTLYTYVLMSYLSIVCLYVCMYVCMCVCTRMCVYLCTLALIATTGLAAVQVASLHFSPRRPVFDSKSVYVSTVGETRAFPTSANFVFLPTIPAVG